MSAKIIGIIALVIIVLVGIFYINNSTASKKFTSIPSMMATPTPSASAFNFENQTFVDNSGGNSLNLSTDNFAAKATSQSGSRAAAVLIDNFGGSGFFYYLVGGSLNNGQVEYSQPIALGDRIQIVSLMVDDPMNGNNGQVTVNYLDRGPNTPMSSDPTVSKTKTFNFESNGRLKAE